MGVPAIERGAWYAQHIQRLFGNHLFEVSGLTTKISYVTRVGLPDDVSGQALLAGLHKVLGPFIVMALGDAFAAAQLGYAVFATQAIQYDTYLLLRTVLLTRFALDVTNDLF